MFGPQASGSPIRSILSREREIAELTHQVEALDEAAAAADDARTAAQKAEADARGRAEALQREVVELERRTAKLVLEEREVRSAWEAWQRREADLRRSREEMEVEAERAQERVEAALGAVESKTEALDEIQHAAGEAAALHDRLHDRLVDLKRAAAESIHREAMKKLEASQARESRTEAERRLAETQSDIARESKRLEETREVLDAREDERLQSGTSELLEKNARLEKALAAAQTELEAARSKREDEQRQIKRLNESILPLTEEIARPNRRRDCSGSSPGACRSSARIGLSSLRSRRNEALKPTRCVTRSRA